MSSGGTCLPPSETNREIPCKYKGMAYLGRQFYAVHTTKKTSARTLTFRPSYKSLRAPAAAHLYPSSSATAATSSSGNRWAAQQRRRPVISLGYPSAASRPPRQPTRGALPPPQWGH